MSNHTSTIHINVDTKVKVEATTILNDLGMSMSTAVNIFLAQVIKQQGIPFKIKAMPSYNKSLSSFERMIQLEKESKNDITEKSTRNFV